MNFHPAMIATHIAITTNGACRQKPPRLSRAITGAALLALAAVLYFGARAA